MNDSKIYFREGTGLTNGAVEVRRWAEMASILYASGCGGYKISGKKTAPVQCKFKEITLQKTRADKCQTLKHVDP